MTRDISYLKRNDNKEKKKKRNNSLNINFFLLFISFRFFFNFEHFYMSFVYGDGSRLNVCLSMITFPSFCLTMHIHGR